MAIKQLVPNLHQIGLGGVNCFLIEDDDGLILIDIGAEGSAKKIGQAVRKIGRQPADVQHILVTHCHPDHAGSLAELKRLTGAPATMHPIDAAMVETGRAMRPMDPPPGLFHYVLYKLVIGNVSQTVQAAAIEQKVADGDTLPLAGGLQVIHAPGHCAGQIVFLWPRHGGVLFAADAAANMPMLGWSVAYEDLARGQRSLEKLAALEFEVACFGHGSPILKGAAGRFRKKWGAAN